MFAFRQLGCNVIHLVSSCILSLLLPHWTISSPTAKHWEELGVVSDLVHLNSCTELIAQGTELLYSEGNRIQSHLQKNMFSIWIRIFFAVFNI